MDYEYQGYTYKIYSDGKSIVIATASYAGQTVRGIAKCDPQDEFDYNKGAALAVTRCALKIAFRRHQSANKKFNQAKEALHQAEKRYDDMTRYLADTEDEVAAIVNDLIDIEKEF